jgi:hypothetical protein
MEAFRISDERIEVPFSTDKIEFAGNTAEEKALNKELFNTILELNSYQDRYDNGKMKDVEDIKEQISKGSILSSSVSTSTDYENGFIDALKWVVDGCLTENEKHLLLPKLPDEELKKLANRMRETVAKMTSVSK